MVSVFVRDNDCDNPLISETVCDMGNVMHNFVIDNCDTLSAIKKLKSDFTMGPDNVPAFLVKDCASCLSEPLCRIFNLIIQQAVLPEEWKISKVPIFKSGDRSCIENFRPVALISNFAKVFESIVAKNLQSHIRNCIHDSQHGFVQNKSTATNLCQFVQYVSTALHNKQQIDIVYTDLSKAFDVVNHRILSSKLISFGLCDNLVKLFASFLSDRKQYVECGGFQSGQYIASSGVTQGSNLGPLLFIIYFNDVLFQFKCPVFVYADDLKIVNIIHSESDCCDLQEDLNNFNTWCSINKQSINVSKCKLLRCLRIENVINFNYTLNGMLIEQATQFKDLGVIIDSKLTFVPHIQYICAHATKMLGFIIRNTNSFKSTDSLITLFNSYIRSKLEYCSIVWQPYYNVHILLLELIQRRFCKYLFYIRFGRYPERHIATNVLLDQFNLCSLDLRRKLASILFLYKLVHGRIVCTQLLNDILLRVPRLNARHPITFSIEHCRTNQHFHSPLNNMCRNYNDISYAADIFLTNYYRCFHTSCKNALHVCAPF
jgi:hypothetical protein